MWWPVGRILIIPTYKSSRMDRHGAWRPRTRRTPPPSCGAVPLLGGFARESFAGVSCRVLAAAEEIGDGFFNAL